MLLNSALISSFLLASAVLADRHRRHELRHSGILSRVEQSANVTFEGVQRSNNWAGAILTQSPDTFTAVQGKFVVPQHVSGSAGSGAFAWVGIDGNQCQSSILQTGVTFNPDGNGGVSYQAWYEWYPDAAVFLNMRIQGGDTIKLSVHAKSANTGIIKVKNLSNDAEWIVEDYYYYQNRTQVPFADFGTVTFTGAQARGSKTFGPDGATVVDMVAGQNGPTLASASTNWDSVTIKYTGPGK